MLPPNRERNAQTTTATGTVALFTAALAALAPAHIHAGECLDPEGNCAAQPCPSRLACSWDADCPEGYLCGPGGGSSVCSCEYSDHYARWLWNCSDDVVGACIPDPGTTGPRGYTITDLGTLGGLQATAHAINNRGQVVGEADTAQGVRHAFLRQNGVMTDIGLGLPPPWSSGSAINNAGQIVVQQSAYAYLWDKGVLTGIGGSPSQPPSMEALAINDAGQIVGYAAVAISVYHGFLWDNGVMTDLTTTFGIGFGRDINNLGHIATSDAVNGVSHAAVWNGERIIDVGTLGGRLAWAESVNDLGQVIGLSERAPGGDRLFYAFLWQNGVMTDLSELAGARIFTAEDVNNCGETLTGGRLYHPDYGFRTLLELIPGEIRWHGLYGESINDAGQIVGTGMLRRPDGSFPLNKAFLLDPTPGDLAPDGAVDLRDFAIFQKRFNGASPPVSGCRRGDLDRDADTDLNDFRMMSEALTGPRVVR